MSKYPYIEELTVESVKQYLSAKADNRIISVNPEFYSALAQHYLDSQPQTMKADYFDLLVDLARQEAAKAISRFPQPNYTLLKFSDESGEVIKGAVHYGENRETWENVEREIIQTLAMTIRFLREGDGISKIYPPQEIMDDVKVGRHE